MCETITKFVSAVLFARVPELPAMSKWTNVACCVDCFVGLILASVLEQLFTEAFRKIRAPTKAASTTEGSDDLADDGSSDWHEVAGRRLSRVRAAVASRVWRVSLVMQAIFTEPLRMMTRFFVHCSSTTHRHCSPPYLVDLANPASDCGTIFVHVGGQQARRGVYSTGSPLGGRIPPFNPSRIW